jgi:SAM-dependent methyltransferase
MVMATSSNESHTRLERSVAQLYRNRFPSDFLARRAAIWRILCRDWLSRYIPASARVLEIAAGYCEFINNIPAAERVAIDLNPETRQHASADVAVHLAAAEAVAEVLPASYFDTAFMSNFLEHCRSREHVLDVLRSVWSVLRPGGSLLILGPNFRYCLKEYFDYFDHYLPLTEKAVVEALELTGFRVEVVQARTLPFTFRSRLPSWPWLVKLYLRLPLFWHLFGAQFFLVASKPVGTAAVRAAA